MHATSSEQWVHTCVLSATTLTKWRATYRYGGVLLLLPGSGCFNCHGVSDIKLACSSSSERDRERRPRDSEPAHCGHSLHRRAGTATRRPRVRDSRDRAALDKPRESEWSLFDTLSRLSQRAEGARLRV